MVKKGSLLDKFDSIRFVDVDNDLIAIGAATSTKQVEIEFYDKNLILTQGWDQLPVLESFFINAFPTANWAANLNASGQGTARFLMQIYNCEKDDIDDDHLIGTAVGICMQSAGAPIQIFWQDIQVDKNIPLRNKITFQCTATLPGNAAGANFPANFWSFNVFLDVDYVKYTNDQLKDWIMKELFIDQ